MIADIASRYAASHVADGSLAGMSKKLRFNRRPPKASIFHVNRIVVEVSPSFAPVLAVVKGLYCASEGHVRHLLYIALLGIYLLNVAPATRAHPCSGTAVLVDR